MIFIGNILYFNILLLIINLAALILSIRFLYHTIVISDEGIIVQQNEGEKPIKNNDLIKWVEISSMSVNLPMNKITLYFDTSEIIKIHTNGSEFLRVIDNDFPEHRKKIKDVIE